VEKGQEDGSFLGNDLAVLLIERSEDVDLTEDMVLGCHCLFLVSIWWGVGMNVSRR
jgi:hypothetical protein